MNHPNKVVKPASDSTNVLVGKHFPVLDGLRGVAIIGVMFYHFLPYVPKTVAYQYGNLGIAIRKILMSGWIGVDLFFVLSGFLITGILLDTKTSNRFFTSFYARRFLRIFPAYYAVLCGFLIVLPIVSLRLPSGFRETLLTMKENQAWFWTYTINWFFAFKGNLESAGAYLWSLAVEEQFYLIWPITILWLDVKGVSRLILFLLPVTFLLRLILLTIGITPISLYVCTFTHMDGLLAGSLVACMVRKGMPSPAILKSLRIISLVCVASLTLIGVRWGGLSFKDPWVIGLGIPMLAICTSSYLLHAIANNSPSIANRFLTCRTLLSFGQHSYAIYLLHLPVSLVLDMTLLKWPTSPWLGSAMLTIAVLTSIKFAFCWAIGLFSWHLFEKHFLKLKIYFPYQSPTTITINRESCEPSIVKDVTLIARIAKSQDILA